MIQINNLSKKFNINKPNEKSALNNINLTINVGELIAIMGKSGAGKTTLLNILSCLDQPTSGEVLFNNENIQSFNDKKLAKFRSKTIGLITQNPFLIEECSALENVVIPLLFVKMKQSKRIQIASTMLNNVALNDCINQRVSTMSGGERQRVVIARALINDPQVILADEPTGSLDSINTQDILTILKNINKLGKTVIIVTHDKDIAQQCNRIITMSDGSISNDKNKNKA